jgi:hypothetical protein
VLRHRETRNATPACPNPRRHPPAAGAVKWRIAHRFPAVFALVRRFFVPRLSVASVLFEPVGAFVWPHCFRTIQES